MTFVFDLDGTLIDSTARHYILMRKILSDKGISVASGFDESYMKYKADGNNGKKYLTDVLGINEADAALIQREWVKQIEDESYLLYDKLYDDSISTLNLINDSIVFLTIRSNESGIRNEIKRLGIDKYPLIVLSHGMDKADAIKDINDKVTVIGDTELDYKAAIDTGSDYYILNRGFRSKQYWDQRGVISHSDLGGLIK